MIFATTAYNRPEFIELQLNSIKKHEPTADYIVYDTSIDGSIGETCKELGVECIRLSGSDTPSSPAHGIALNEMWQILMYKKTGVVVIMDSDVFLTAKLPDITGYGMAFIPAKGENIEYPWAGFVMLNMDRLECPEELRWGIDKKLHADTAGEAYYYINKYQPKIMRLHRAELIGNFAVHYGGGSYKEVNMEELKKLL